MDPFVLFPTSILISVAAIMRRLFGGHYRTSPQSHHVATQARKIPRHIIQSFLLTPLERQKVDLPFLTFVSDSSDDALHSASHLGTRPILFSSVHLQVIHEKL